MQGTGTIDLKGLVAVKLRRDGFLLELTNWVILKLVCSEMRDG